MATFYVWYPLQTVWIQIRTDILDQDRQNVGPDQDRQNVGPDLGSNRLTLTVFLKEYFNKFQKVWKN